MTNEPYITSVDFGSSSIKIVVARIAPGTADKVQIMSLVETPSNGIKKGVVTNMNAATDSLVKALDETEAVIGLPVDEAVFGINGTGISFVNSEGIIVNSREGGDIVAEDVDRLVGDAVNKAYGIKDDTILHIIPKSFKIDNQDGVRDPVGMVGNKIECKVLIVSAENSFLRNFTKAVDQAEVDISTQVYTPLATSDFLLSDRQKQTGTVLVDIGAQSTTFVVWEDDEIYATGMIPIGGAHITSDLAVGLQTNIEMAEEIKKKHLDLNMKEESETQKEVEVHNQDLQETQRFNLYEAEFIAGARIDEIFEYIDKELYKIGRQGKLAGGAVLTGGSANIFGVEEIAKQRLKIPVFAYKFDPAKIDFVPDYDGDPVFLNAIALSSYYLRNGGKNLNKTTKKTKKVAAKAKSKKPSSGGGVLETIKKILPWM